MNRILSEGAASTVDARIKNQSEIKEHPSWDPHWTIRRWDNNADFRKQVVYDEDDSKDLFNGMPQETKWDGNLLCTNGLNNLFKLLATTSGTQYNNATAYLGVGTSSTAAVISDTALGAGAVYQAMDTSYPAISGTYNNTCTWRGTYASGSANQAWNEFGIFTSNAGANMLNHVISAQGTKVSGQTWQLDVAITLT